MSNDDGTTTDPSEQAIEAALRPGRFIPYGAMGSFLDDLKSVETRTAAGVRASPSRAVTRYETFIAGCYEKAQEIDDSDGGFGQLVERLFCGWVKARRAAGADPDATASRLLAWMDDDPYGFCYRIEGALAKALDKLGLAAFERRVRERFQSEGVAAPKARGSHDPAFARRRWGEVLRALLVARRDVAAYVKLCEETDLTPEDALAIARMLQARRKPAAALDWVERGLGLSMQTHRSFAGHDLDRLKRELLRRLGRDAAALQSAWAAFESHPHACSYEELMRYVPEADRATWHARAMDAAAGGDLHSDRAVARDQGA